MSDDVNNGINSGIALQYLNYIEPYVREIEGQRKEIASLKELVVQATPYVEYAARYSTPLSQKLSEEWLEKTQARREK